MSRLGVPHGSSAFFIHKEDGRALIISARTMDNAEKKRYGRK